MSRPYTRGQDGRTRPLRSLASLRFGLGLGLYLLVVSAGFAPAPAWPDPRLRHWASAAAATTPAAAIVQGDPCRRPLDQWTRHLIDAARPGRAAFLYVVDLDQDGRPDLVTGGYWYANPGNPAATWPRTPIGAGFDDVIAVHDFDEDGDLDLLGTAGLNNQPPFVWARHEAGQGFTIFTNLENQVIPPSDEPIQGVAIARLQPGGPLEVALAWDDNIGGTQLFTVPAAPASDLWQQRQASSFGEGEALSSADIDGDGDGDLFTGSSWLRNDGPPDRWTPVSVITFTSGAPDRNRLIDMDEDGDLDAVVGYGHDPQAKVAWYEQVAGLAAPWPEHLIANLTTPGSSFPQSLDVGDIDGDGDLDVVAGQHRWYGVLTNLRVYVLENLDGRGETWATHLVHSGDEHHDGTQLLDVEGDGDLDIVSIGWTHGRVVLYENRGVAPCLLPTPSPLPATATPTATLSSTPTSTVTRTPTITATPLPTLTPDLQPTATTTGGMNHHFLLPWVQR